MVGIIELLRDCRAKLAAATKSTITEAPGYISAANELIEEVEAQIGSGPQRAAAARAAKPDLLGLLRRHKAGMRKEAVAAAMGWSAGLVSAQLARQVKSGRVSLDDGIYRVVEPTAAPQPLPEKDVGEAAAQAAA